MANQLVEMVAAGARRYGRREAYRFCWRKDGEWLSTSWADFKTQTEVAAVSLAALGLTPGDRIAICSPNTPQIFITELGAFANGIASIPIYSSSSQSQFDFIAADGEARVIFIGDRHQYPLAYNFWKAHPDRILKIVIFKNIGLDLFDDDTVSITWDDFVRLGIKEGEKWRDEIAQRTESAREDDMATLIYTSGTSGEPKGVVISHANYAAAMNLHLARLTGVSDNDLSMSFLPMSHILEKAWVFFCLTRGIRVAVNYDPRYIQDTIKEVQPTVMCCVPRFWEKVYAGVRDKIRGMSRMQRLAVARALRIGKKRNLKYMRLGHRPPRLLELEYRFWDKRIFSRLKEAIGIPHPNMFPTAGAPLSDRICAFMHSVGINVVIGYGLSETTATVTCFPNIGYEIGTVGTPLEHIEVRIDPANNEILVKGPTVTPGYYNNPEANKAAFTDEGFFRTGDAGYLTAGGALKLTERVKDLFKTSNGKYIAPQALESRLAENKYIDEAAVIGEGRKFVTALIVPNFHHLREWAEHEHIQYEDTAELVNNPKVEAFYLKQINQVQKSMADYEKIKKIALLPNHFSIMNGEVTNTMKVRRNIVAKRYARQIEDMYDPRDKS